MSERLPTFKVMKFENVGQCVCVCVLGDALKEIISQTD